MRNILRANVTELSLLTLVVALSILLSVTTRSFFSVGNAIDLLNASAVNIIFAIGLLVVLIAGGVDISFSVAASVVQYVTALALISVGGGNWAVGFIFAAVIGTMLGVFNAFLIHQFKIISIIVTISTFNIYFGLLMFFTKGVSIYALPDWLGQTTVLFEREMADGNWIEVTLPVVVMAVCVIATWTLVNKTTTGRQLYAFGDNPEGARRLGINVGLMQFVAFGWLGMMAGIGGLMQVNYTKEIVPNAMAGRELDVLAAVVLGGARLGGGRGSVLGCVLGVLLISVTQNGLNLLGISPFAFKMVVGLIILAAIAFSSFKIGYGRPKERAT